METRYLISDIIDMLKIIKDEPAKQKQVSDFLEKMIVSDVTETGDETGEYDNVIPRHIITMLMVIKYDQHKLLRLLNFIEDEIIDKKEDKNESNVVSEYKTVIPQIMEALNNGFIVYLNPETMEMEQVESETVFNLEEFQEQNDDRLDDFELNYATWDDYIKFEPLGFDDITTLTEDFTRDLADTELATRLEDALSIEESLDDFMAIVNSTEKTRKMWDNYINKAREDYVCNQLVSNLKNEVREDILQVAHK